MHAFAAMSPEAFLKGGKKFYAEASVLAPERQTVQAEAQ